MLVISGSKLTSESGILRKILWDDLVFYLLVDSSTGLALNLYAVDKDS